MLSNKSRTPSAFVDDMKTPQFSLPGSGGEDSSRNADSVFTAFDEFLDRMPAWIFHSLGTFAAVVALWFALAYLGGLPGGVVEWIALAMVGGFAYAVGFMIPLVMAYLLETRSRLMMALLVAGGGAVFGAMTLQLPL